MTVTDNALFNIIKASLWPQKCDELILTEDIKAELRNQSIEGLAATVFPESVNDKYLRAAKFAQMLSEQENLINCIKQADISVAVIKGVASGIYYPAPYLRRYGDIDILVHPDNYNDTINVLLNNGYKIDGTLGRDVTAFKKEGFEIELHQRSPGGSRVKEEAFVQSYLLLGLKHIEYVSLSQPNTSFPMLPWKQNGLELILHIRTHLYNGLGLRQIIDWMMFAHKCLNTIDRFEEFREILDKSGLYNLAITVTRMCQIYLGLDETISWCRMADDSLCEELMNYILDQGNFGVKRQDDKAVKVLTKYRNPFSFLKALQDKGARDWKLAKKYKVLKLFAWVYMGFRGVILYSGKNGKDRFVSDLNESTRRRELLDKLYGAKIEGF